MFVDQTLGPSSEYTLYSLVLEVCLSEPRFDEDGQQQEPVKTVSYAHCFGLLDGETSKLMLSRRGAAAASNGSINDLNSAFPSQSHAAAIQDSPRLLCRFCRLTVRTSSAVSFGILPKYSAPLLQYLPATCPKIRTSPVSYKDLHLSCILQRYANGQS